MSKRELLHKFSGFSTMAPYFFFINNRHDYNYKILCFVEGKDDENFYKGNLYRILMIENQEVNIRSCGEEDGSNGGKEKVIRLYHQIKESDPQNLYRCIFIVDKDYDDLSNIKYNLLEAEIRDITILPCYSFENLYLYDSNLRLIFYELFGPQYMSELKNFKIKFDEFLDVMNKYFAIKRISVCYDLKNIINEKNDDVNKCLENHRYLERALIERCVAAAENRLRITDKNIYDQYLQSIKWIRKRPHLVRGKTVFNYLVDFLNEHYKIPRNKNKWLALGSILELNLDIKYIDKRQST